MNAVIEALSDTRREILLRIKRCGGATISEIAGYLEISDEGARQHLIFLERQGWISRRPRRSAQGRSGRPASVYEISSDGDNLFPKRYDELSIALLDTVNELHGPQAVEAALSRVADQWVSVWEPRLRGLSLGERLDLLRDYYGEDDPFLSVERNGHISLVERNCPYRNVAMARPPLCSITINTLSRLLGYRVVRTQKFQAGDGCCEFRVLTDQPVDATAFPFRLERTDVPSDPSET